MADRRLFVDPDGFVDEVDPDGQMCPRFPAVPELWAELEAAGYPHLTDPASTTVCIELTIHGDGAVTAHTADTPAGLAVGSTTPALAAWLAANLPLNSRLAGPGRDNPATGSYQGGDRG